MLEGCVPESACGGFVIASEGFGFDTCRVEGHTDRFGEKASGVETPGRIGFRAHVVNDVSDDDAGRLGGESEDEGGRIGPARASDERSAIGVADSFAPGQPTPV